ncbi:hypothetical protein H2204_010324 [Knufia peltigerae]|uniref:Flavin-containing monooxygenase YUCCA3 n=1 Tax=Knufia peltigerae TaxID=1002370 RepID=A0AA38XWA8_9EURO|nr:hypothetical protein H2204_010324 [Knufia peltigerae]
MLAAQPQPHDVSLHLFNKSQPIVTIKEEEAKSPREIAQQWLERFASALSGNDLSQLPSLIHSESWWRDHLALEWDFHTLHTLPTITSFLQQHLPGCQFSNFKLAESGQFAPSASTPIEGLEWIESMFSFDTKIGRGKGMIRLVRGEDGIYKGYMLHTSLQELKGFEESSGARRPHGGNNSLTGGVKSGNWLERRQRAVEFQEDQPQVLIIGAGQAGLNMAARLQSLNMSTLLIDKNARVGDNWRSRYRTLVTHDPVQYTHMYGLPFPSTWPLFTPKDKLGDWFEAYASLMELNVWTNTKIVSVEYSDKDKKWTVVVDNPTHGGKRTLTSNYLVFCTGHAGEPMIPTFPGQETFVGTVYHGSQHQDATQNTASVAGKRVAVVGTGNSGHDIAQNYYEAGAAEVTMLQRRGTYVIQASKGLFMLHEGLYDETGPPIEDADVYGQSLPIAVQFALNVGLTERIKAAEKENIEGLERAGFKLDFGHDGSGIYRKYITRGGGYYIDVGASRLIIDGKIKVVQSPEGIQGFDKENLILGDGKRKLPADIVVLATGYDNMRTTARKVLGDKIADRAKDVWDLDEEGEVNAMWRPSGHPRLWFMGGSLALCRIYSRFVALQIKAIEEGLASG